MRLRHTDRSRPSWALEPLVGRPGSEQRAVGALAYRGVTTADIDVPVRSIADRLGASIVFVGTATGEVAGVEPARPVVIDTAIDEAPHLDVLVVPGGLGWRQVSADERVQRWLVRASCDASVTLAISTGSLLLAAAGVLTGQDATGHWLASDDLAQLGAHVVPTRTAADDSGRIATASGAMAAMQIVDEIADRVAWAG